MENSEITIRLSREETRHRVACECVIVHALEAIRRFGEQRNLSVDEVFQLSAVEVPEHIRDARSAYMATIPELIFGLAEDILRQSAEVLSPIVDLPDLPPRITRSVIHFVIGPMTTVGHRQLPVLKAVEDLAVTTLLPATTGANEAPETKAPQDAE